MKSMRLMSKTSLLLVVYLAQGLMHDSVFAKQEALRERNIQLGVQREEGAVMRRQESEIQRQRESVTQELKSIQEKQASESVIRPVRPVQETSQLPYNPVARATPEEMRAATLEQIRSGRIPKLEPQVPEKKPTMMESFTQSVKNATQSVREFFKPAAKAPTDKAPKMSKEEIATKKASLDAEIKNLAADPKSLYAKPELRQQLIDAYRTRAELETSKTMKAQYTAMMEREQKLLSKSKPEAFQKPTPEQVGQAFGGVVPVKETRTQEEMAAELAQRVNRSESEAAVQNRTKDELDRLAAEKNKVAEAKQEASDERIKSLLLTPQAQERIKKEANPQDIKVQEALKDKELSDLYKNFRTDKEGMAAFNKKLNEYKDEKGLDDKQKAAIFTGFNARRLLEETAVVQKRIDERAAKKEMPVTGSVFSSENEPVKSVRSLPSTPPPTRSVPDVPQSAIKKQDEPGALFSSPENKQQENQPLLFLPGRDEEGKMSNQATPFLPGSK